MHIDQTEFEALNPEIRNPLDKADSRAVELLSGDFAATTGFFPDSASPRLVEAMKEYLARLEEGQPVNRREFLERYADIAVELEKCLGGLEFIHGAAPRFSEVGIESADFATSRRLSSPQSQPVGDFRIVREIGRGGMGVVYEAEQLSLSRRVALKVLPFGAALDSQSLQRFRNESLAAAQLDHPHIVHVYGVGCDRGVHYYAMRYIEGRSLAEVIAEMKGPLADVSVVSCQLSVVSSQLSVQKSGSPDIVFGCASRLNAGASQVGAGASRLNAGAETVAFKRGQLSTDRHSNRAEFYKSVARLGIQVAEALDYAHSRGIIHRDVKPGNLLIDDQGKVWVADFGVAHVNSVDANLTITGQLVGTLRYMSPEQLTAERGLVDQRSDIYSLGATLYELLTLAPVYAGKDRAKLMEQITQDDPAPLRRIDRTIPEELETIVLKCLEKEPTRRYATAQALADDLGRFLANRPIVARRAGPTEMFRKWSRRHRAWWVSGQVFAGLLTVGTAVGTWLVADERERRLLQESAAHEQKQIASLQGELAAERQSKLREIRYVANINLCDAAWKRGDIEAARGHLAQCLPGDGEEDLRGFEWRLLARWLDSVPPPWAQHRGEVYFARFSPDGTLLATCGQDGVTIRNFPSGETLAQLKGHTYDVNGVDFSSDGKLLATASDDETVKLWDTGTWTERQTLPQTGCAVGVAFTPDGKLLAIAERMAGPDQTRASYGSNVVRLWNCVTREVIAELAGHSAQLQGVAISADGRWVASACDDGAARVWGLDDFSLRFSFQHPCGVRAVAFAHTRPLLATVGFDGIPRLFDLTTSQTLENLAVASTHAESIAWAHDDTSFATAARDGLVRVWEFELKPNRVVNTVTYCHGSPLWCVVFSPDGKSLVSTALDGSIRRWDRTAPQDRVRLLQEGGESGFFDFVDGQPGKLIACRDTVQLLDLTTGTVTNAVGQPGERILRFALSRDGRWLATLALPGGAVLKVRDAHSGAVKWSISPATPFAMWFAFDPRDDDTLIASVDPEPFLLNVVTGKRQPLLLPSDSVMVVSPTGATVISANGTSGASWMWDRDSGKTLIENGSLNAAAFTRDGRTLASVASDGTIHFRQADSWEETAVFLGNPGARINALAFSADGKTLAGACLDGTVRLWHVGTGRELLSLGAHSRSAELVRFSPDGTVLASSGLAVGTVDRREILIWNTDGK